MSLFHSLRVLRDHERGIQADPAWVLRTRERLIMQVKNSMPTAAVAQINRRFADRTRERMLMLVRGPAAVGMAIIAVIFGGSFVSVRAAERSLPGDALYSLKLVTEQAQLALESSKTGKVKLKVEFAKRRIEELQTIMNGPADDKTERASQVADILKQDLHTIKEQLANVSKDSPNQAREVAETAKAVDSGVADVVKTLNETKNDGNLTADAKQKVSDAEAQAVDVGMSAIVTLIQATKSDSAKDVASAGDINASLAQHVVIIRQAVNNVLYPAQNASSTYDALLASESASSTTATSSIMISATSTPGIFAHDAAAALAEAETLIQESKTEEAADKIKEANTKSILAQTAVAADIASASSTAAMNASTTITHSSTTQTALDAAITTTTSSNATTTK